MASDPVNDAQQFVADHGRLSLGMFTGGMSEKIRFLANEAKLATERIMPEEPDLEKTGAPPTSSDPAVAGAKSAVQNANRNGRASTILTRGVSAANSNLNLSRRTLLGA